MKIEKIQLNASDVFSKASTKITTCGDIVELLSIGYCNRNIHIRKIDNDTYEVLRTHEIRQFNHNSDRNNSIAQSFVKLRHLINANITSETVANVLWVTLTYAENMTDTERLYDDFRKFIMRLRYYCKSNNLSNFEYITVVEPQARGAWHHHALLIWDSPAPFIPNKVMAEIWGFGFTKVQSLKNKHDVTNIGKYLTAYLTDIDLDSKEELAEVADKLPNNACKIKNINSKRYVKGARIHMYPKNMRIFRHSRNIKLPKEIRTSRQDAIQIMYDADAQLQYHAAYFMHDEKSQYSNTLYKECYSISPTAKNKVRFIKASQMAKSHSLLFKEFVKLQPIVTEVARFLYMSLFDEFVELQPIVTEFAEYYKPAYMSLFDEFIESNDI